MRWFMKFLRFVSIILLFYLTKPIVYAENKTKVVHICKKELTLGDITRKNEDKNIVLMNIEQGKKVLLKNETLSKMLEQHKKNDIAIDHDEIYIVYEWIAPKDSSWIIENNIGAHIVMTTEAYNAVEIRTHEGQSIVLINRQTRKPIHVIVTSHQHAKLIQ